MQFKMMKMEAIYEVKSKSIELEMDAMAALGKWGGSLVGVDDISYILNFPTTKIRLIS